MRKFTILLFFTFLFASFSSCRKIPDLSPSSSNLMVTGEPILIPGHFWVAQFDFPEPMDYLKSRTYAQGLGSRWDLPSKKQAEVMMLYKDSLLELNENVYWTRSSTGSSQSLMNMGGGAYVLSLQSNEILLSAIEANYYSRAIYR